MSAAEPTPEEIERSKNCLAIAETIIDMMLYKTRDAELPTQLTTLTMMVASFFERLADRNASEEQVKALLKTMAESAEEEILSRMRERRRAAH